MASKTIVASKGIVGQHSFLKEEAQAFASHINFTLKGDEYLNSRGYLPLDPNTDDLFRKIADGILLCKLINVAAPETIDERALNFPVEDGKALNPWEMTENQNVAINSAKSIGCQVVNIHANALMKAADDHKEYLVLGLVWQVVKVQLLSQITIKEHPELVRLLKEGEELVDMLKLPPEEILLRWINYHLKKQGQTRVVNNFSSDLSDGEVYLYVLNSIGKDACPMEEALSQDPETRARTAIENANNIEVPAFIQPGDILSGNKRLNLAFCAQIFNTRHGLEIDEAELKAVEEAFQAAGLEDEGDDAREERVFRMWMNSLNLGAERAEGPIMISSLFDDLSDGIAILEAMDKIQPGIVDWSKVTRDPAKLNTFRKVENCNYAVNIGKQLAFSMPGTGGKDLVDKNKKLVLGLVWQLMRMQTIQLLQQAGGGEVPKDADIIAWANEAAAAAGSQLKINSFKDITIADGLFLLDMLAFVEPRAINPEIVVRNPISTEDKITNARYVLSVARKLGVAIFCTFEDILEVKPKQILCLVAGIMTIAKQNAQLKK